MRVEAAKKKTEEKAFVETARKVTAVKARCKLDPGLKAPGFKVLLCEMITVLLS